MIYGHAAHLPEETPTGAMKSNSVNVGFCSRLSIRLTTEATVHMPHTFDDKKAVRIGKNVHIEVDRLVVGDGVKICDNVSIEGPEVYIGDYTLIRENTQLGGNSSLSIGMCCWIGQGVIVDSTELTTVDPYAFR
jgi:UDP-3-O-[3-hydroxymyristoyl] glucosamine N-acyltransferase